jgi:hypothetical protein
MRYPRWEPYAGSRKYGSGAARLAAILAGESPAVVLLKRFDLERKKGI